MELYEVKKKVELCFFEPKITAKVDSTRTRNYGTWKTANL